MVWRRRESEIDEQQMRHIRLFSIKQNNPGWCSFCLRSWSLKRCSVCHVRSVCGYCLTSGVKFHLNVVPRCKCKRYTCWHCLIVCWGKNCRVAKCVYCAEKTMYRRGCNDFMCVLRIAWYKASKALSRRGGHVCV